MPSTTLTKRLTAYLIVGRDVCLEFRMIAGYDRRDPYAVRLDFPLEDEERERGHGDDDGRAPSWTFGRELIAEGMHAPAGEGDVRVWPFGSDLVMVELRSDAGSALIAVPVHELRAFLFLSYAEVPPGYEGRYLEMDRELHDLMGRA
jgi:hypothetical protein